MDLNYEQQLHIVQEEIEACNERLKSLRIMRRMLIAQIEANKLPVGSIAFIRENRLSPKYRKQR